MQTNKTGNRPNKKTTKARAWNANGWNVFFKDGHSEWAGARSAEEAISLYPETIRRKILAVVLSDAFPKGPFPVETDIAFAVIKTRVMKRKTSIPTHKVEVAQ